MPVDSSKEFLFFGGGEGGSSCHAGGIVALNVSDIVIAVFSGVDATTDDMQFLGSELGLLFVRDRGTILVDCCWHYVIMPSGNLHG